MKDFIDYSLMWLEMATHEKHKKRFISGIGDMGHDYFADFRYNVKSTIAPNLSTMMYMQIDIVARLNFQSDMRFNRDIEAFIGIFKDYKDSDEKLPDMSRTLNKEIRSALLQIWYILDLQKSYEKSK